MRRPDSPRVSRAEPVREETEPTPAAPRRWRIGRGRAEAASPDEDVSVEPASSVSPPEQVAQPELTAPALVETEPFGSSGPEPATTHPKPVIDDRRVVEISDHIAERDRAEKRVFWRRVLWWGLAAVLVIGAAWLAYFSPVFALDGTRITVNAAEGRLDLAAVQRSAASRAGTPLPRLDVGALEAEIAQVPTVATVDVHREWPNGLAIDVAPRVPVAAVPSEGGVQLFDAEGVDLGSVPELPEGVPLAEVPLQDNTADILQDIAVVMGSLPPEVLAQITTVRAESPDAIEFDLVSESTVRWGANSENDLKASVLETLLLTVQAGHYDVSTPRTPMTS